MTWFKVDDGLATHQKVLAAGNAAMGLWVRAGAWCSQQLTDGHVPLATVRLLGNVKQAKALVAAGLWIEAEGGYQFHDWSDYQPTRERVERTREERRQAGRRGGLQSGEVRSKREATSKQGASPLLNPRPDPTRPDPSDRSGAVIVLGTRHVDDACTQRIRELLACPEEHARKVAERVLERAPGLVRDPAQYVLSAVRNDPDAYRYRRGNPKTGEECPTHPGQWPDKCSGCAADRKAAT